MRSARRSACGAEIVTVPPPDGDGLTADEERMAAVITDRAALVAISHVLFAARGFRSATPRDANACDVVVDYRLGVGIRLSLHFYTEDEELDHAFESTDEIRASGAWKSRPTSSSLVT